MFVTPVPGAQSCQVAAGGTTVPKLSGAFPSSFPTWALVGENTAQKTKATTEPAFMRVNASARCSQATTQGCQAGPQHGGYTQLRWQQRQRGGGTWNRVGRHEGSPGSWHIVQRPSWPPRNWPVRSNGTGSPVVPGSSWDADEVARPGRLQGAQCPCCEALQLGSLVLDSCLHIFFPKCAKTPFPSTLGCSWANQPGVAAAVLLGTPRTARQPG